MGCRKIGRPSEKITRKRQCDESQKVHGFKGGVAVRKDAELELAFWIKEIVFAKIEFYQSEQGKPPLGLWIWIVWIGEGR